MSSKTAIYTDFAEMGAFLFAGLVSGRGADVFTGCSKEWETYEFPYSNDGCGDYAEINEERKRKQTNKKKKVYPLAAHCPSMPSFPARKAASSLNLKTVPPFEPLHLHS